MDRIRAVASHLAGGDPVSKLTAKHPDDGTAVAPLRVGIPR